MISAWILKNKFPVDEVSNQLLRPSAYKGYIKKYVLKILNLSALKFIDITFSLYLRALWNRAV